MNDEELKDYLIRHLAGSRNPNDLILEVCEKTGKSWNDVQAVLEQVRSDHEREITLRQSPMLTLIAIGTGLGGLGVALYSVFILAETIQAYSSLDVSPLGIPGAFNAIASAGIRGIGGLLVGAAMVLGSTVGMRKVWAAVLKL